MVRELLGGVGPESLVETTYALHERRAADALRIVDRLSGGGKDLGQFVGELLAHLRNLMLLPYAPEIALAGIGAEERPPLEEQANAVPTAEVVRLVTALDDAKNRMRRGGDPKLELELIFLKLTRDYAEPDLASILARLETLEKTVEDGGSLATSPGSDFARQESPGELESAQEVVEMEAPSESAPDPEEPAVDLASEWQGIMGELKRRRQALTAAVYGEARVEGFDGEVLRLLYPEEQGFHVGMARDKGHTEKLTAVLEERLGTVPRLEIRASVGETSDTTAATAEESPPPASPTGQPAPEPAVEESTTEALTSSRGTVPRRSSRTAVSFSMCPLSLAIPTWKPCSSG